MARQKITWTQRALSDQEAIFEYWIERNGSTKYARELKRLFRRSVRQLRHQPLIGSIAPEKGLRFRVVKDYKIYYFRSKNDIYILRIWDSRRNPEDLTI